MLRVVGALALLAFTVYTLVDCVQSPEDGVKGLPKLVWVFVILLFPLAGGIAWFLVGRPTPLRPLRPGPQDRPRGPRGPDDDPDFLRGL